MESSNKKNYSAKHPGKKIDPILTEKITKTLKNRKSITCKKSHKISKELRICPKKLGVQIDLLELKINECQLELFGYKNKHTVSKKAVDKKIKLNIMRKQYGKKLSCYSVWSIARNLGLEKTKISAACEILGISISECQLGAF